MLYRLRCVQASYETEALACRNFSGRPGAERSWILTFPFSLGSVPEVSCGLCSSRQGMGCPGPCPSAAQADQLCGLPRRPPASRLAERRGWGCRDSPSKAGHLLFSWCLPAETLSAPHALNWSGRTGERGFGSMPNSVPLHSPGPAASRSPIETIIWAINTECARSEGQAV